MLEGICLTEFCDCGIVGNCSSFTVFRVFFAVPTGGIA
jgi:hypothetical protein